MLHVQISCDRGDRLSQNCRRGLSTSWRTLLLQKSCLSIYRGWLRYRLHIVSERVTEIKHCLLVMPGTQREDIRRVISDPQVSQLSPFVSDTPAGDPEALP